MANDRFLQMLGIAKRARLLSEGHDVCVEAIKKGKARICLFASDASERLIKEFETLLQNCKQDVPVKKLPYSMNELNFALAYRAAVLTVNDEGIAKKLDDIEKAQNGEEN